jgi:beta-lactamase superfamily II metal-dependent hydrolase
MLNQRKRQLAATLLLAAAIIFSVGEDGGTPSHATFTVWQLPNQTPTQMMSYVVRTGHERLIVIDGGNAGDAGYLKDFIRQRGNVVDAWFISHMHSDHLDALCKVLAEPDGMEIKTIYADHPDADWMRAHTSENEVATVERFVNALSKAKRDAKPLRLGDVIEIDGIRMEVLAGWNPEITQNAINNSSVVLRMSDAAKSVLFLGDLGLHGGEKLLQSEYADRLPSDYVQMAHHGQNGVSEAFYQKVNPTYCLWPAPKWLWDNDNGGGKGSGPWRTLEVRGWMEKLPVKKHYLMSEGLQQID